MVNMRQHVFRSSGFVWLPDAEGGASATVQDLRWSRVPVVGEGMYE